MEYCYKLELSVGEPIEINELGKIYQPTIKDVIDYNKSVRKQEYEDFKNGFISKVDYEDIEPYNKLLMPFLLTKDILSDKLTEEELEKVNEYDMIWYYQLETEKYNKESGKKHEGMLEILIRALKFFYKTDNVIRVDKYEDKTFMGVVVNEEILIHRENFKQVEDIILNINKAEKPTIQKLPKFKSEKAKESWLKMQEGRNRKNKSQGTNIASLINAVKLGGKNYISSKEILEMTIWEIHTNYQGIISNDHYDQNMRLMHSAISMGGKIDDNIKHFTETLKI